MTDLSDGSAVTTARPEPGAHAAEPADPAAEHNGVGAAAANPALLGGTGVRDRLGGAGAVPDRVQGRRPRAGRPTDTAAATDAQAVFLLVWFVGIVMLTVASLRLPSVFTLLFVLDDAALAVVYFGTVTGSTGLLLVGGILVFAFAAIEVYLFLDAMGVALGGAALPMGAPVLPTRSAWPGPVVATSRPGDP